MPHVIEPAASGRSRCRGCGKPISKGTLRFGERLPNHYSNDGDLTVWYHLGCAAYRRPEPFLAALESADGVIEATPMRTAAEFSRNHHRVCRIGGVERATSGRARCRACRTLISRGVLRIPLLFYEEGTYSASGFIHLQCAESYFGSSQLLDCIRCFSPDLAADDLEDLQALVH